MDRQHLISTLIVMGQPRAQIEDYLDTTSTPTIDGFYEYAHNEEGSYNAQVRWDALQSKISVPTHVRFDGCYALLDKLPRHS